MSDDLFTVPTTLAPELDRAREDFAKACEEYDTALDNLDHGSAEASAFARQCNGRLVSTQRRLARLETEAVRARLSPVNTQGADGIKASASAAPATGLPGHAGRITHQ